MGHSIDAGRRGGRTGRGRRSSIVVVALAVSTMLTACAPRGGGATDDQLTVDEAKSETQALESGVADALGAGEVVSSEQAPDGVLLSCSDTTWQWTGRTTFQLDGSRDRRAVLEAVGADFADVDGFTAGLRDGATTLMLVALGPDGLSFVADMGDTDVLTVSSASRCFELRDGESSFDTF